MPFISVKLAKGRTIEQKQEFVDTITKEAVRILKENPKWVIVVFMNIQETIGQQQVKFIHSNLANSLTLIKSVIFRLNIA